ncbi:hypothetical protein M942_04245 [Enterobacter ludwigii]|nr:hypothetical protein M942_04245 [Enterobacter ludwigii]
MSWWELVFDFLGLVFLMVMMVQTTQFFKS